jgi:hypothetical protein
METAGDGVVEDMVGVLTGDRQAAEKEACAMAI